MKVKEVIMKLKNKNKIISDIGQTSGLPEESTVWNIIKNKEYSGGLINCKGFLLQVKENLCCWWSSL